MHISQQSSTILTIINKISKTTNNHKEANSDIMFLFIIKANPTNLTFLAVTGSPAAVAIIVLYAGPEAIRAALYNARAHIVTLFGLLVSRNEVIKLCMHYERPVHRVDITQLLVLLDPNGPPCDVPQVVQADVFQAGHLIDYQSVVVEEVASSDDTEVGEECAEAVEAGYTEQEQVICDHCELREAK